MKLSEPPVSITTIIEAINNNVKAILQHECGQELYHWLTNNLLPSLAWLATDHLASCVAMGSDMTNTVVYQLSTLSHHIAEVADFFRYLAEQPKNDGNVGKEKGAKLSPAQCNFLQRKTRQMNILVYSVTCNVLRLMSDSLVYLRTKPLSELEGGQIEATQSTSEDVDLDIASSLVWLDEKDFQLCITLTSKVDVSIENCVATITVLRNINGMAGTMSIKVTHYPILEQNDLVFKVYFNTILPKEHRKILAFGKDVGCATFTVTIQDSVQRWKENAKLQPRLLGAIAAKVNVPDSDLHCLQVLKSTDGLIIISVSVCEENDCVVCILRLFAPRARALLRVLRKYQRCMDFQLLNVVDIREGMPPECVHQYGQPEVGVFVTSSLVMENTTTHATSPALEEAAVPTTAMTANTADSTQNESSDPSAAAPEASVGPCDAAASESTPETTAELDSSSSSSLPSSSYAPPPSSGLSESSTPSPSESDPIPEPPPRTRKISFSAINRVERSWTSDICISESVPVLDPLVVQEELFRQEIVVLLAPSNLDQHLSDCHVIVDEIYRLLDTKYMGIANSNFVKELFYQLSLHRENISELRHIGSSVSQQTHTGGSQGLYTPASRTPAFQQMVNLFMNTYILRHHLELTSQEHVQQLADEVSCCQEDENLSRESIVLEEFDERTRLSIAMLNPPQTMESVPASASGEFVNDSSRHAVRAEAQHLQDEAQDSSKENDAISSEKELQEAAPRMEDMEDNLDSSAEALLVEDETSNDHAPVVSVGGVTQPEKRLGDDVGLVDSSSKLNDSHPLSSFVETEDSVATGESPDSMESDEAAMSELPESARSLEQQHLVAVLTSTSTSTVKAMETPSYLETNRVSPSSQLSSSLTDSTAAAAGAASSAATSSSLTNLNLTSASQDTPTSFSNMPNERHTDNPAGHKVDGLQNGSLDALRVYVPSATQRQPLAPEKLPQEMHGTIPISAKQSPVGKRQTTIPPVAIIASSVTPLAKASLSASSTTTGVNITAATISPNHVSPSNLSKIHSARAPSSKMLNRANTTSPQTSSPPNSAPQSRMSEATTATQQSRRGGYPDRNGATSLFGAPSPSTRKSLGMGGNSHSQQKSEGTASIRARPAAAMSSISMLVRAYSPPASGVSRPSSAARVRSSSAGATSGRQPGNWDMTTHNSSIGKTQNSSAHVERSIQTATIVDSEYLLGPSSTSAVLMSDSSSTTPRNPQQQLPSNSKLTHSSTADAAITATTTATATAAPFFSPRMPFQATLPININTTAHSTGQHYDKFNPAKKPYVAPETILGVPSKLPSEAKLAAGNSAVLHAATTVLTPRSTNALIIPKTRLSTPALLRSFEHVPSSIPSRKELIKMREELTRERLRQKHLMEQRRIDEEVRLRNQELQMRKREQRSEKEKRLKDMKEKTRCVELHALLRKGGLFGWMPAQPPPPPPPVGKFVFSENGFLSQFRGAVSASLNRSLTPRWTMSL